MKTFSTTLLLALVTGAGAFLFSSCSNHRHEHSSHHNETAAAKAYPLNKCLVSDEGFDHGEPYTFVHEGQQIKLCCKDCLSEFQEDPAKFLSKLAKSK